MEFMTMDQRFRRGFTAAEKMTGPSEQSGASAQRTTSLDIRIQNPLAERLNACVASTG
jgi:hypothetical protein